MKAIVFLIVVCLLKVSTATSQSEVYVTCADSNLFLVDVSNCNSQLLCTTDRQFYDIAVNPIDGNLYGVDNDGYLSIIDTTNCSLIPVGNTMNDMVALTFSEMGILYGMRWGTDHLFQINPNNGTTVSLGSTGTGLAPKGDLTFYDGFLYYSGSDPPLVDNSLIRIDLNNISNSTVVGVMIISAYGLATLDCESSIYASTNTNIRKLDLNNLTQFNTACSAPVSSTINGFAQKNVTLYDGEFTLGNDTTVCSIDSIVVGTFVPNGTYTWSDGSNSSQLEINQDGLYWVEVTAGNCFFSDSISVAFSENPAYPFAIMDTVLCPGEILHLNAANSDADFLWQDGSMDSTYTIGVAGSYWVDVSSDGCTIRDSVQVDYTAFNQSALIEDTALCDGETIVLNAYSPGAYYFWQDGSADSVFYVDNEGLFWVEVALDNCYWRDSVQINGVNCEFSLDLPNVFTPNGDFINDVFTPTHLNGVKNMETQIVNRWGNVMYSTDDITINWDGKNQQGEMASEGVYYYVIRYESENSEFGTRHGYFHLALEE